MKRLGRERTSRRRRTRDSPARTPERPRPPRSRPDALQEPPAIEDELLTLLGILLRGRPSRGRRSPPFPSFRPTTANVTRSWRTWQAISLSYYERPDVPTPGACTVSSCTPSASASSAATSAPAIRSRPTIDVGREPTSAAPSSARRSRCSPPRGSSSRGRRPGTHVRERRYWNLMDPDVLAWRIEAEAGDALLRRPVRASPADRAEGRGARVRPGDRRRRSPSSRTSFAAMAAASARRPGGVHRRRPALPRDHPRRLPQRAARARRLDAARRLPGSASRARRQSAVETLGHARGRARRHPRRRRARRPRRPCSS